MRGAIELAFEQLIAELETETAEHVAGWWREARTGGAAPPAPASLAHAATRRVLDEARVIPALAERATPWWRAALLAGVEADAAVAAACAPPWSWSALACLARARNAAARSLGFSDFAGLAAAAQGIPPLTGTGDDRTQAAVDAARGDAPVPPCAPPAIIAIAGQLAARLRVDAAPMRVDLGREHRTFVVSPGRDVRIVVSGGRTVWAWQQALHEVGHGLVGAIELRPSRAIDEAVATWTADRLTVATEVAWMFGLEPPLAVELAGAAEVKRRRRRKAAALLAGFETVLYREPIAEPRERWHAAAAEAGWSRVFAVPPRAFRDDPGAQPAYQAAEVLADRLGDALAGGAPLIAAIATASALE